MPSSATNQVCLQEHCGHANLHTATTCARCGAELSEPTTHSPRSKGLLRSLGLAFSAIVCVVLLAMIVERMMRFLGR